MVPDSFTKLGDVIAVFRIIINYLSEVYSQPCSTSKLELFVKIVNGLKSVHILLLLLT